MRTKAHTPAHTTTHVHVQEVQEVQPLPERRRRRGGDEDNDDEKRALRSAGAALRRISGEGASREWWSTGARRSQLNTPRNGGGWAVSTRRVGETTPSGVQLDSHRAVLLNANGQRRATLWSGPGMRIADSAALELPRRHL
eukprot:CAMPEP_0206172526 /NCGR_PEP_ID=MMETSP1474-20131121/45884_1 /ASSEMBLY_ACC=CAM_ASM_001110 /TAXON_ID=97495 /ORGANISM="Imantonia sp., Strain RCC918" /LENGTH=140 /DNA_ID=CAMNT_0053580745 /DNA_START=25 /DNA_END=447 /DNA_ORIENTATION=+